jgi:cytochrome c2
MLEPQAHDSFFRWGFFNSVLEKKEAYSDYVFEDEAEKLLADEPELAAKFADWKAANPDAAVEPGSGARLHLRQLRALPRAGVAPLSGLHDRLILAHADQEKTMQPQHAIRLPRWPAAGAADGRIGRADRRPNLFRTELRQLPHGRRRQTSRAGPGLFNVVGRKAAGVPGYNYTDALTKAGAAGKTWTREELDVFLRDPNKDVPGTAMPIGIADAKARAAVIDYLATQSGNAHRARRCGRKTGARQPAPGPTTSRATCTTSPSTSWPRPSPARAPATARNWRRVRTAPCRPSRKASRWRLADTGKARLRCARRTATSSCPKRPRASHASCASAAATRRTRTACSPPACRAPTAWRCGRPARIRNTCTSPT